MPTNRPPDVSASAARGAGAWDGLPSASRTQATRIPLTDSQRQLWFIDQLNPRSAAYNITRCYEIHGPLDVGRLATALTTLVARHEALRTTIQLDGAEPAQVVHDAGPCPLAQTSLEALPPTERRAAAIAEAKRHACEPFDLQQGPLFRAELLRLGTDEHWLLLNMHHIVTDGPSVGVIARDLSALYTATAADALPPAAQFPDFAIWLHERFEENVLAPQLAWWREHLREAPETIALAADRSRPETASLRGSYEIAHWPAELRDQLRTLARAEETTVFVTTTALTHTFLTRLTGENDVVLGTPMTGRLGAASRHAVGFFVNMVPLRARLAGDPAFRGVVRLARDEVAVARDHAALPYERLVRELCPRRSAAFNPIFQVVIVRNRVENALQLPGLQIRESEYPPAAGRFDLLFEFLEHADGLDVRLEYSTDRFEAGTARWMLEQFTALARAALVRPDDALSALASREIPTDWRRRLPPLRIDPAARFEPFPLTAQQATLPRDDGAPSDNAGWISAEIDWPDLERERLEAAVATVRSRHDATRARIHAPGMQAVATENDSPGTTAFAVAIGPVQDGCANVRASFSRLFFDHASADLLLDELRQAYENAAALPAPATLTFRDYVLGLDALRTSAAWRHARAHWQTQLATLPPAPDLPVVARTATGRDSLTRDSAIIDGADWRQLRAHAPDERDRPEALLFAMVASVLAGWTKSARFTIAVEYELRLPRHEELSRVAGNFTDVLPVSIDEADNASFLARVRRATDSWNEAFTHAACGGADLQLRSGRNGGDAGRSLWPVVFSAQLAVPVHGFVSLPSLRADTLLAITAEGRPDGGVAIHFDSRAGAFPDGLVSAIATATGIWARTLAHEDAAWQYSSLTQSRQLFPATQAQCRAQVNATAAAIPEGFLFSEFLHRVAESPRRPAVITPQRTLDYGELHAYACALAGALREVGVQPNQLVAIAMEKGWEQVAAALGIQLAGGAYLPVDSELPPERMTFLIEHGEARAVVVQSALRDRLALPPQVPVIVLDQLAPTEAGISAPAAGLSPTDLAYVIFTSGSTGLPKGVMIDHRGALNTVVDVNRRFRVGPDDRVLGLSRLSFDLSVYDIFGLLGAGGALVLPEASLVRDPAHWAELVRRHRVTIWNTVPALMQLVMDFAGERRDALGDSLRVVMMSGDWIPLPLPDQIRKHAPAAEIISLGGATEASIWSILHPITQVDPQWRSIPYGRPMVNQTFHVLHENLAPCPDHVVGELFIGGIGVAQGYWKDAEKTAARFITHPASGERLYRTGDLGRYFPDGTIEFLGREDFQVKIQGYRIELGEIESALLSHPAVRNAVVVARGERDGNRQLVGYIVAAGASSPEIVAELRAHLARQLPAYMVPAVFAFLEQLPLTANGKVDVKALPDPGERAEPDTRRDDAPRSEFECIVHDIWKKVLGRENFGAHDNFFTLGGGSLSGTRVIFRVREAFEIEAPVRMIFDHPTVARMAAAIEELLLAEIEAGDE